MPRIGRGRAARSRATIRSVPSPPITMYRSEGRAAPPGTRPSRRRPRARAVNGSKVTATRRASRNRAQWRAARRASAACRLATMVTVEIVFRRVSSAMNDASKETVQGLAAQRPGRGEGQVHEELAVPFGSPERRDAGAAHREPGLLRGRSGRMERLHMLLRVAHDSSLAGLALADLE